ncbi:AMP-binding protein [Halioxenophilus sp. WMMB6]|uniref:AMP-binding protein n=1 Tax=Halioxenophilus sp. WMMB6 TaxID=3073815 RepID=UPI00295E816A|nr:AMP-binding protein [Halioxenophilus sp. WMMB6]
MTASYFQPQLQDNPEALAITDLTSKRTWLELDTNINGLASLLRGQWQLSPGDHIALLIGNRVEYVEAMLAGMLAGLWVTPINTHLAPAEIDYIRRDCGAKLILHDHELADLLLPESTGETVNVVDAIANLLPAEQEVLISGESPAGGNMLYTSGTTGRPKGVKRAKPALVRQMIERLRNLGNAFGLIGRGPHLVTGPLYHAAPGMFAIYDMLNGAPMIILPKWDNATFFDTVATYRVATTHLVPTMFVRLLEARNQGQFKEADHTSLKYVFHGAAPISRTVKQQMIDWWGPILSEYWGATESGVVTMIDSFEWAKHPGSVGRAVSNFTVFIGDENGNPSSEPEGLLYCRHQTLPQVFDYHNDPEKTRKAHPQPYVFTLGDIGKVDKDGFVYLSDRESNMIISGGVNIYPSEIEQALQEHELVVDVAVFGVPNPEWGEEVKAVIQLRTGNEPLTQVVQQLRDFLANKIARFKIPRSFDFIEELPRNPSGKVLIRQLKDHYTSDTTNKNG